MASLQSLKAQVSGPLAQSVHSAAVLRRDAGHRAEDGDCLEAAENPPELIPGGEADDDQKHTHSAPSETALKLRYWGLSSVYSTKLSTFCWYCR